MTTPPSPLAAALETINEVRRALAYVPALCARHEWDEALDVVDEQLVQLQELRDEWAGAAPGEMDRQLHFALEAATRRSESLKGALEARPVVEEPGLSRPGGPPAGKASIDYVDVPLGF